MILYVFNIQNMTKQPGDQYIFYLQKTKTFINIKNKRVGGNNLLPEIAHFLMTQTDAHKKEIVINTASRMTIFDMGRVGKIT